jgi:hypothetical protein
LVATLFQGWMYWHAGRGFAHSLARGSLCAVTLSTGQVYYGKLLETGRDYVRLGEVYYAQSTPQANGGPPAFSLVSRQKNDWHAPGTMVVPVEKILLIEDVSATSRLGQLILQDQSGAGAPH